MVKTVSHGDRVVLSMMIDKKVLDQLLRLPDDQLLQMLQLMSGGNYTGKLPDEAKMRRIRAVLREITDEDLCRIAALATVYQNTQ